MAISNPDHCHPSLDRYSDKFAIIQERTESVPKGLPFGTHTCKNYSAFFRDTSRKVDRRMISEVLNYFFYDDLQRSGKFEILETDRDLSWRDQAATINHLVRPILDASAVAQDPTRANIDYAFIIKSSLRERWKQCDRDARVAMENYSTTPWGEGGRVLHVFILFMYEHQKDTLVRDREVAAKIQKQLSALNTFIHSLRDPDAMAAVYHQMALGTK